jgi:uncharacterized protein (UPF0179 family)
MVLVTLIGEKIAEKDMEFSYIGPNNDCRNCKLKNICFNLKVGRKYKITGIRDKKHSCNVHDGPAVVVEVTELPLITCADKNLSEGEKTTFEKKPCESIGCKYYNLCKISLNKDKKYEIVKIFEEISCPLGKKLQKTELKEL